MKLARFDYLDKVFAIKREGHPLAKPIKPTAEQDTCFNHGTQILRPTGERYPSWRVQNAPSSLSPPNPLQRAKPLSGYG